MSLSDKERASIVIEEYKALYSLLTFRFTAIERRVAFSAIIISSILGLLPKMELESKIIFLVGVPIAIVYLIRSTILHIRSLEDYFRKIEEAELRINEICSEQLMQFQSGHPSRGTPGGRASQELLHFVLLMGVGILCACSFLMWTFLSVDYYVYTYWAYTSIVSVYCVYKRFKFLSYKYNPSTRIKLYGA